MTMDVAALPDELLLRFLQPLSPFGGHASVSVCCRALLRASTDDRLWVHRLARDFPLASRKHHAGSLWKLYRLLTGGRASFVERRASGGELEAPAPDGNMAYQAELRRLASHFHRLNVSADLDAAVNTRSFPVTSEPFRPAGAPPLGAGPPAGLLAEIRHAAMPRTGPVPASGSQAALFDELRRRRPTVL
mmetsp:Transcript_64588/g.185724  ORF Transcript_64588/g.185724 Transcript_64588/m.185724 type:complete len:190 (-) Transcript_64588:102-671(-)